MVVKYVQPFDQLLIVPHQAPKGSDLHVGFGVQQTYQPWVGESIGTIL